MLQTKQDYLNCLAMNPQEGKEELKLLLDSRFTWLKAFHQPKTPQQICLLFFH